MTDQAPVTLKPGDTARSPDGRPLSVVRVAQDDQGRQEVLAVGNFGPSTEVAAESEAAGGVSLEGPLPLPYSLPE